MVDRLVIDGNLIATLEVPEELGALVKDWDLDFEVETEEELRKLAGLLGGIERLEGRDRLWSYKPTDEFYPKSEHGRTVNIHVWLSDELAARPDYPPPPVIERLKAEAAAERGAVSADG